MAAVGQTTRPAPGGAPLTLVEPIRRSRIYEGIVAQIEALLERGELSPGDQLPPERVLAEQFGVSRASVREALRWLELLGIVESRPGGGTFVSRPAPGRLVRPLASLMARAHSIPDVIEVREIIEPSLAARAAARISDEQLEELRHLISAQEAKVAAGEPYTDEDTRFHEIIGHASGNELLVTMLAAAWDVLRASREEWLQTRSRATSSLASHRRVLAALEARDPVAAREASAEHIGAVGEGILALIEESAKEAAAAVPMSSEAGRA